MCSSTSMNSSSTRSSTSSSATAAIDARVGTPPTGTGPIIEARPHHPSLPPGPVSIIAGLWCLDIPRISSAGRALAPLLFLPTTNTPTPVSPTGATVDRVGTDPSLAYKISAHIDCRGVPPVDMAELVDALTMVQWLSSHRHYFLTGSHDAYIGACRAKCNNLILPSHPSH
jgi:hypothetical protein